MNKPIIIGLMVGTVLIISVMTYLSYQVVTHETNSVKTTNVSTVDLNANAMRNTSGGTTTTNTAVTNSSVNTNTAPVSGVAVLPLAQRVSDATSTLSSPVKVPTVDGRQYWIVGQPQGQNSKATKKIIFSLPGHDTTAETDYEAWKKWITDNDYAIASLNWWDGNGEKTSDYYTPNQVMTQLHGFLTQQGYDADDFVVLEGFSRGSANTYPVTAEDILSGSPVIDAVISASGKYQSDFSVSSYASTTPNLYRDVAWILACGDKDDNPERDGCIGMNETKTWLTTQGANVLAVLSDPNGAHGAFHGSPLDLVDQALALLDSLPEAK